MNEYDAGAPRTSLPAGPDIAAVMTTLRGEMARPRRLMRSLQTHIRQMSRVRRIGQRRAGLRTGSETPLRGTACADAGAFFNRMQLVTAHLPSRRGGGSSRHTFFTQRGMLDLTRDRSAHRRFAAHYEDLLS